MRVAIAGSGDLARYLSEEIPRRRRSDGGDCGGGGGGGGGHDVVILSRSHKRQFDGRSGVTQRVTDYSLTSLIGQLADCDVLVSTIMDYSAASFITVHEALIDACTASPRCRRFIPSEFGGNVEEHADQPAFYHRTREPVRQRLRTQTALEWTLVSVGWLIDYVVPTANRYFKDIGEAFPVDLAARKIVIPGTGDEAVDVTWGRDVARGVAALLDAPTWATYTYMSGQQTCWNEVAAVVTRRHPDLIVQYKSVTELDEIIKNDAGDNADAVLTAEYQIFSTSGAGALPRHKVAAQREKFFLDIHFRNLHEGLDEVERDPTVIV